MNLMNVFLKEITGEHCGWLETEDNTSCQTGTVNVCILCCLFSNGFR